jgi:hypothetical protein
MITIEIEGKEWDLPSDWTEVNLEMFEKIVYQSNVLNEYKSNQEFALDMFSVLTGAPKSELIKLTRKSFDLLSEKTDWVTQEVKPTKKREWTINGVDYIAVEELSSLTMGESISLELMINNSTPETLLTNILPILIRKVKVIEKENGEIKKVPQPFNDSEYAELKEIFKKNLNVADVYEIKDFFLGIEK